MNTKTTDTTKRTDNVVAFAARTRHSYRARGVGMGYGTSSGYGAARRYTSDWGNTRFRFA
jgi:hypothetical protein